MTLTLPPFSAVVFDCDGVLADTDEAWADAERAVCERYGGVFDDEIRDGAHGQSMAATAALIASRLTRHVDIGELASELRAAAERAVAARAVALPGVVDLLTALSGKLPMAAASNTGQPLLDAVLSAIGVRHLLDVVLSADDVARPKPAPDLYLEAARRLGVPPSEILVLEDSPSGAAAGVAAGCLVVAVTAPGRAPVHGAVDGVLGVVDGLSTTRPLIADAAARLRAAAAPRRLRPGTGQLLPPPPVRRVADADRGRDRPLDDARDGERAGADVHRQAAGRRQDPARDPDGHHRDLGRLPDRR